MADESEVTDALVDLIASALYPNGAGGDSAVDLPCKIYPGWPVSADLEKDLALGLTHVSVFPVPGGAGETGQPFLTEDAVLTPPQRGLTATISGPTIVLTGSPVADEYVTAAFRNGSYSYVTQEGNGIAQIAAGLAGELRSAYPSAGSIGPVVQVGTSELFEVRIGAPMTMGARIHRQRQQYRITIWASTPESRSKVAAFVDLEMKRHTTFRLPDTSLGLMTFQGTMPSDGHQQTGLYRRDLMFNVTYDTLDTYRAYEITHVGIDLRPGLAR